MSNILIITDTYIGQINGVTTTMVKTVEILREQGHRVTVVSPDDYIRTLPFPGYPQIRIPLPDIIFSSNGYGIKCLIQNVKFDAIHIATEGVLGIVAKVVCDRLKIKYTTAYHTQYPSYIKRHYGLPESFGYKLMHWFHDKSSATMVPTNSMIETLKSEGFKNLVFWGRGVDKELFKPRDVDIPKWGSHPYWLNVGRVSREKNLDAFLSLDLPGTKIIVGDGPYLDTLKANYPETIFLGALTGLELALVYNYTDVFVFPSVTDTYGLVVAEAIASGCPVAAYNVTGPKDIVENGCTGILDDDLRYACLHALYLCKDKCKVERDFSWEAATTQFYKNLGI